MPGTSPPTAAAADPTPKNTTSNSAASNSAASNSAASDSAASNSAASNSAASDSAAYNSVASNSSASGSSISGSSISGSSASITPTSHTQTPIITLTLNPALDLSSEVPALLSDTKLRCTEPLLDPGGGGLNVSRAIAALHGESLALVALGGLTGDRLAGLIRAEGVPFLALTAPGETRQSLTVTDQSNGRQYRFMLPGPIWSQADQARVFTLLRASARTGAFGVISGSQPPGVPVDFPARLARAMPGLHIVLDTSGPALHQAVTHPIPNLAILRMDDAEAETLAETPLTTRSDTADFAQSLVQRGVAQTIVIARGADGSVLVDQSRRIFAKAARVKVKSTVGAGDSFVAALILSLARGNPPESALAFASAAASAAVTTDATQLCKLADVMRLLPECLISQV